MSTNPPTPRDALDILTDRATEWEGTAAYPTITAATRVLRAALADVPEVRCPSCDAVIRARLPDQEDAARLRRLEGIALAASAYLTTCEAAGRGMATAAAVDATAGRLRAALDSDPTTQPGGHLTADGYTIAMEPVRDDQEPQP